MKKSEGSRFHVVIEKAKGNFSAYSPDLPGCIATGRTRAEVGRRMRAAIRMHLQGLKEDKAKPVKCGDCGKEMQEKPEKRMGLKIIILECPPCGKRLIDFKDAIRLQKRGAR